MNKKEEILKQEKAYQGRVFNVQRATIRLSNGKESIFHIVEHPGAVVVLPVLDDGSIVFVRQWRRAVKKELLEIVAGTLEIGEEPLACAKRELAEEACYAASEWISLGEMYPAPGFCSEVQHGYLARGLTHCGGVPDEDEIIEMAPLTMPEVKRAIAAGEIADGKSLAYILRAMERGLLT